ncbi:MAG TPA: LytR C-terminal domain-containing protein [Jatrophihabitans sp.]|nr:LytR C-terminal domain-containing protein [Jatrophihabitans sp.]
MAISTARRPLPALVFLLALLAVTVLVWVRVLHRSSATTNTAPTPVPISTCASAGAKPLALPAAKAVSVVVLNGAGRDQLATTVSNQLKARGFRTGTPADAPSPYAGVAEVEYGRAGRAAATLLGYYVPGAKLIPANRADAGLTLILGSGYRALASQAAVNAAVARASKPCG